MTKAIEILQRLERERFFGTVSFQFQAGDLVIIRKEETIKPYPTRIPANDDRK